jgi:ABC-type lipoprotein release transport system permease subunit
MKLYITAFTLGAFGVLIGICLAYVVAYSLHEIIFPNVRSLTKRVKLFFSKTSKKIIKSIFKSIYRCGRSDSYKPQRNDLSLGGMRLE